MYMNAFETQVWFKFWSIHLSQEGNQYQLKFSFKRFQFNDFMTDL